MKDVYEIVKKTITDKDLDRMSLWLMRKYDDYKILRKEYAILRKEYAERTSELELYRREK